MRTLLRTCMLITSMLILHASLFSQQVAKTIPNSTAPEGLIGFLEFKPADYGTQRHPLIIFLHGYGERGNGTSQIGSVAVNGIPNLTSRGATMSFKYHGQTSSFVVLSPQLSTWYGYWPTFYITEMIKYAKANLSIDPNRIYITGLSLGGGATWRAITEAGTENGNYSFDAGIAAAAPVCGTEEENDGNFCRTIGANHLPVWAFHSMDDGTVGVGTTQHAEILANMCGVTPAMKFTYYLTGGHGGAWINAYDTGHLKTPVSGGGNFNANPNLYEWFLSNTRGETPAVTNTPPTVNAGTAQAITLPLNTITLTGSASGTNGASITSYSWTKTSGPSGGSISLPLLNTSLVTGLVAGTYVFTLTATDDNGLSSSSSVTVTVNPLVAVAPNQIPVGNAGPDITITAPTSSVMLDGSGSYDPDGTIQYYWWSQTSGPNNASIDSRSLVKPSLSNLVPGTYTFTLQLSDNKLALGYAYVKIVVNPAPVQTKANQIPVGNAGPDQTITAPANSVTVDGSGSYDPDGTILYYWWTQTSGPNNASIDSRSLIKPTFSNLVPGSYLFTLQLSDNNLALGYGYVRITVNAAQSTPPPASGQPIGYIKQSWSYYMACGDASSDGRIPVYGNGVADGNVLYLDAARTQVVNGGWNWFSFTQTLGGPTVAAFAVYPIGVTFYSKSCTSAPLPVITPTAPTGPAAPTTPTPAGNLLGYIKVDGSPDWACADASTDGRIAVYGKSISNGSVLYLDAAMTQIYNGGWNWHSFTPTLGGATTAAFAVYPVGSIFYLRSCNSSSRVAGATDFSTVSVLPNATAAAAAFKLNIYPNPVRTTATIELNSAESGAKTINLYNASGVLSSKYTWQTSKGNNTFSLKNLSALPGGLYIADIRDSNGKSVGLLKFVKQ